MKASLMIIFVPGFNFQGFPFLRSKVIFLKFKKPWPLKNGWLKHGRHKFFVFQLLNNSKIHIYLVSNCGHQRFVHEMLKICPPCFSLCFPTIAYQRFRGIDLEYLEPFLDVDQHDSNCLHDWIWMCRSFVWKVPNLWFLNLVSWSLNHFHGHIFVHLNSVWPLGPLWVNSTFSRDSLSVLRYDSANLKGREGETGGKPRSISRTLVGYYHPQKLTAKAPENGWVGIVVCFL